MKLVSNAIRDFYAGNVAAFFHDGVPIFDDIRSVLDEQFARLRPLEQSILVWLAIAREPTSLHALHADLVPAPSHATVLKAIRGLQRRSLLETSSGGLALQNEVIEYLTGRLIDQVCSELISGTLDWVARYALLKTNVKEYVRQSQVRLIVQPIAQRIAHQLGADDMRPNFDGCWTSYAKRHGRRVMPPGIC